MNWRSERCLKSIHHLDDLSTICRTITHHLLRPQHHELPDTAPSNYPDPSLSLPICTQRRTARHDNTVLLPALKASSLLRAASTSRWAHSLSLRCNSVRQRRTTCQKFRLASSTVILTRLIGSAPSGRRLAHHRLPARLNTLDGPLPCTPPQVLASSSSRARTGASRSAAPSTLFLLGKRGGDNSSRPSRLYLDSDFPAHATPGQDPHQSPCPPPPTVLPLSHAPLRRRKNPPPAAPSRSSIANTPRAATSSIPGTTCGTTVQMVFPSATPEAARRN
jgi:hypothetical protein